MGSLIIQYDLYWSLQALAAHKTGRCHHDSTVPGHCKYAALASLGKNSQQSGHGCLEGSTHCKTQVTNGDCDNVTVCLRPNCRIHSTITQGMKLQK